MYYNFYLSKTFVKLQYSFFCYNTVGNGNIKNIKIFCNDDIQRYLSTPKYY